MEGVAAVPSNPLALLTLARGSRNRPIHQRIAWKMIYNTRKHRNRQAIKCITRPSKIHALDDPQGERRQAIYASHKIVTKLKFIARPKM